jgi:hypothetical protein
MTKAQSTSTSKTTWKQNKKTDSEYARFAYLVAAPRDFIFNLAINTAAPYYALKSVETVSWLGNPSLMTLLTPMAFLLVSLTTFCDLFNGLTEGKLNKDVLTDKLKTNTKWIKPAIKISLIYGLVSLAIFVFGILLLNWLLPNMSFAKLPLLPHDLQLLRIRVMIELPKRN